MKKLHTLILFLFLCAQSPAQITWDAEPQKPAATTHEQVSSGQTGYADHSQHDNGNSQSLASGAGYVIGIILACGLGYWAFIAPWLRSKKENQK